MDDERAQDEQAQVMMADGAPDELGEVVDATLEDVAQEASNRELVVADATDLHAVLVSMDEHDAQALVERMVRGAQSAALKKRWVYEIGRGRSLTRGLTGDAVEDVVQQMNWTGKCAVRIRPGSAIFETVEADEGYGLESWWCVTVEAEDLRSGLVMVGTSMEPQCMRLTPETVARYETEGKRVMEGGRVFDRFSRAKALTKAQRNALEKHIPEVVKETILAMAAGRPELVERMQTEREAKVTNLPPALATPEAQALREECEAIYDQIREVEGGQGKVVFPPSHFAAWMLQSQHAIDALERMREYLAEQLEQLPARIRRERLDREAADTVLVAKCPSCGAASKRRCVDEKGKPKRDCPERLPARRAQLEKEAGGA